METKPCYLHDVEDGNETHYHPDKFIICILCAVKLWELAQHEVEFDMRGQVVFIDHHPTEGRFVE